MTEVKQIIIDFCKKEITLLESELPQLNAYEDIRETSAKIDSLLMVIDFIQKDLT
ncbi:MAG: hypothetical protein ACHQ1D_01670 [Nitrososphaerales archaeon]